MKSADFLDELQAHFGVDSDNKLAKATGWERTRVSGYRTGRREFDDTTAIEVAGYLDYEPIYVMLEVQAARAPQHEVKVIWRNAANAMLNAAKKGKAAALVGVAIIGLSNVSTDGAMPSAAAGDQFFGDSLYIMRIWVFMQWLLAALLWAQIDCVYGRKLLTTGSRFAAGHRPILCPLAQHGAA